MDFIPVCEPLYLGNEVKYATEAVASGWISSGGKYVGQFEDSFASYCGVDHGVSVSNGTTALHLALLALGVEPGDEVIIPDFAMIAVLASVLYCGATPVFVDVESDTANINLDILAKRITSKTKAIILVHTYGHPVDMDRVSELSEEYGIPIVEDAAEAHGAEWRGRKCGSFGTLACFSFYANKIITCGEGGMVLTSSSELFDRCRYFKNHCFAIDGPRDFVHKDLGFNYRLTNVQSAIGCAQVENLDEFVRLRRENAHFYTSLLSSIPGLTLPVEREHAKNVYWMYGITVDEAIFGVSRDELAAELKRRMVGTRPFFSPLHRQPMLKKMTYLPSELSPDSHFPVSESLSRNSLYVPSGSGLSRESIEYVCKQIKEIHELSKDG